MLDQAIDFHNSWLTPALLVFSQEVTHAQAEILKTKQFDTPIKLLMEMSMDCCTVRDLLNRLDEIFGNAAFPRFKEMIGVGKSTVSDNLSGSQGVYAKWPDDDSVPQKEHLSKKLADFKGDEQPFKSTIEILEKYWEHSELNRDQLKLVFTPELGKFSAITTFDQFVYHLRGSSISLGEFLEKCRNHQPGFNALLYPATGSVGRALPDDMESAAIIEFHGIIKFNFNQMVDKLSYSNKGPEGKKKAIDELNRNFNINKESIFECVKALEIKGVTIGALLKALDKAIPHSSAYRTVFETFKEEMVVWYTKPRKDQA